eukprot:NODE_77_length_23338_cov_0.319463.p12 type:complete len:124 gc:universal NODE_77_length_23338_cov_0.319463:22193-21822(-)
MQRMSYLGYVISDKCIEVDHANVSAIRNMLPSATVRGIRRFIGTVSYYRNFLYQFARISNPFSKLTSKNARFQCTGACQEAYHKLKSSLCESPVVKHPDYSEPFAIFTDTSSYGVVAVLTQGE